MSALGGRISQINLNGRLANGCPDHHLCRNDTRRRYLYGGRNPDLWPKPSRASRPLSISWRRKWRVSDSRYKDRRDVGAACRVGGMGANERTVGIEDISQFVETNVGVATRHRPHETDANFCWRKRRHRVHLIYVRPPPARRDGCLFPPRTGITDYVHSSRYSPALL